MLFLQDKKEEESGDAEEVDEKENGQVNGRADDTDCEDRHVKSEISGGEEEDDDEKVLSEEKVSDFQSCSQVCFQIQDMDIGLNYSMLKINVFSNNKQHYYTFL